MKNNTKAIPGSQRLGHSWRPVKGWPHF